MDYRQIENGSISRRRGILGTRLTTAAIALLVALGGSGESRAQSQAPMPNGFHFVSASAFSSYYTSGLPPESGVGAVGALQPDASTGVSAVFEMIHMTPRSNLEVISSSSFISQVRYSSLRGFNESLTLTYQHQLSNKWSFTTSAAGGLSSYAQFLSSPSQYSRAVSTPATLDELAAPYFGKAMTNQELAAALTGTPTESPTTPLLFGQRMFSATAQVGLSYAFSSRTQFSMTVGASRTQHLSSSGDATGQLAQIAANDQLASQLTGSPLPAAVAGGATGYALPYSESGNFSLSLSHALTPHTNIGLTGGVSRTMSPALADFYSTTGSVFVATTFKRRWFVELHGGGGEMKAVRSTGHLPAGLQYQGGASVGYKARSNTFIVSYGRMIGDSYGLGASQSISGTGAWNWHRPGGLWWLDASFGQQRLTGSFFSPINSWRGGAGISRKIKASLAWQAQYIYIRYSGTLTGTPYDQVSQSAVQVGVMWTPSPNRL